MVGEIYYFPFDTILPGEYFIKADGKSLLREDYPTIEKNYSSEPETIKHPFPDMTSDITPSPYVITKSGSQYTNRNYSWHTFSNKTAEILGIAKNLFGYSSNGLPAWLAISGNKNNYYKCKSYVIRARNWHEYISSPSTFTFQGCQTVNGTTWETIDTRTDIAVMTQNTLYTFNITNWESRPFYAKFRLHVTARKGQAGSSGTGANVFTIDTLTINCQTLDNANAYKYFTLPNLIDYENSLQGYICIETYNKNL